MNHSTFINRAWLPAAIALAIGLIAHQSNAQSDTLLSRNAATFASSQFQAANLAVDGDLVSRWESTHGVDPSWLTLDLGSSFNLTRAVSTGKQPTRPTTPFRVPLTIPPGPRSPHAPAAPLVNVPIA